MRPVDRTVSTTALENITVCCGLQISDGKNLYLIDKIRNRMIIFNSFRQTFEQILYRVSGSEVLNLKHHCTNMHVHKKSKHNQKEQQRVTERRKTDSQRDKYKNKLLHT